LEIILHRINSIKRLKEISKNYGTEIDIRSMGSDLILNHEPHESGEKLINYLDEYDHGTLVLNIKEAGIENEVLKLVRAREKISSYFLLDVEFPYFFNVKKLKEKNVAIRFSELESIETVKNFVDVLDWVWIDTYSDFPINLNNKIVLDKFKKVLVCPERWGRISDIKTCKDKINEIGVKIDAVMTSENMVELWEG